MRRLLAPLALVCLVAFPHSTPAQTPTADPTVEPPAEAVASITDREIGGHLRFLASDLMKGRDSGSPEGRLAAEYLAAHLFAAGAEPLGDPIRGGRAYLQRFPLEVATPLAEGAKMTLVVGIGDSKRVFPCKLGQDYLYRPGGVAGGEIDAGVVFAGYGRVDPERGINDYGDLDSRAKNRFVLMYEGLPEGEEEAIGMERARRFASPTAKIETARKLGALGVLWIQPPGRQSPALSQPLSPSNLGFDRPARMTLGAAPAILPGITLADPIRDVLVSAFDLPAADAEEYSLWVLEGLRVNFRHAVDRQTVIDHNVVGYFPGADPEKKKEVVVFSAHYDHVGVNENGEIHNGSDDNASGTSALLEIAEAFAKAPRPARSVLFLWVSGEEKGLLGSKWYADHQFLPEGGKIVADINLDMVSRNDPGKISVTPSPKHGDYNSLVPTAEEIGKVEGLELVFDADQFYARTDSYNFAAKGIPAIFFFSGLHEDYHKPTDDVEKADLGKAARVARAAFRLGWRTAQQPEAPAKIQAPAKDEEPAAPVGGGANFE